MFKSQTDTGLVGKDADDIVGCLSFELDAYAGLTHPKQVVVLLRRGILGRCCGRNLFWALTYSHQRIQYRSNVNWPMETSRPQLCMVTVEGVKHEILDRIVALLTPDKKRGCCFHSTSIDSAKSAIQIGHVDAVVKYMHSSCRFLVL